MDDDLADAMAEQAAVDREVAKTSYAWERHLEEWAAALRMLESLAPEWLGHPGRARL